MEKQYVANCLVNGNVVFVGLLESIYQLIQESHYELEEFEFFELGKQVNVEMKLEVS